MPLNLKECLRICDSVKNIFVTFNSNIDAIVDVDSSMEKLVPKDARPLKKTNLCTPSDLFSGLLYSMKHCEAMEIGMSCNLEKWLHDNIKPKKLRMGGQAGIMGNHLAIMGITPIVYSPLISTEQKQLFRKDVLFFDNGITKWEKLERDDPTKTNWIFQYKKGLNFFGVPAERGSRFIASSRMDRFRLNPIIVSFDTDGAILSGFHSAKKKYYDGKNYMNQFRLFKNLALQLNQKGVPVHMEFGYNPDMIINKEMIKLGAYADSIGLDEQELGNIMCAYGRKGLADRIHKGHEIVDLFEGIYLLAKKTNAPYIHLHGRGYFLTICRNDANLSPEDIKKSMEFAAVIAASYAKFDIKKREDLLKGISVPESEVGLEKRNELGEALDATVDEEKTGIFSRGNFHAILVPNRTAKKVKDIVGLGDIISSSIFAMETALMRKKKQ